MNHRLVGCFAVVLCLLASSMVTTGCVRKGRPTERVSPLPEPAPKPPASPKAGDVWVNPKDGMEMVYIPPGEFILGTSDAEIDAWLAEHPEDKRSYFAKEQPQCRVNLPGYWIGRTEVKNAQYLRFVQATGHPAPKGWEGEQVSAPDDFPVVYVDWEDARAYCEWAGGRLPTELEWEKAARGTDGRVFPWGDQWDSQRCRNFELVTGRQYASADEDLSAFRAWKAYHDEVCDSPAELCHGPAAVGSYPEGDSPYGCADMAGNVWEWCADRYDENAYKRYAKGHLTPPPSGDARVQRGSSWRNDHPGTFRCASRNWIHPDYRHSLYIAGFRCARDASR